MKWIRKFLFENIEIKQTLLKNTFWLFFGQSINLGFILLLSIFVARYLGASGYGKFAFAISFSALFSVFADLGLSIYTVREVARQLKRVSIYINNIITIKLILGVLTFFIIAISIQFLGKGREVKLLVYVFGLYVITNSSNDFLKSTFRAFEKMEYEATCMIFKGLAIFVTASLFLLFRSSIIYIAVAYLIGAVFGFFFTLSSVNRRFQRIRIGVDKQFWKKLLKESWPFALSLIFMSIYFNIDSVFISKMLGNRDLGIYSVGYTLLTTLYVIPYLLMQSYFPRLSNYYEKSPQKLPGLLKLSLIKITILLIPLIIILYFFSNRIILYLFGAEYRESVQILQILIIALFIKFYSFPFGSLLTAANRQKTRVFIQGNTALFNIITNFIFIPMLGIIGAALTTIGSEFLLLIQYSYFSKKILTSKTQT